MHYILQTTTTDVQIKFIVPSTNDKNHKRIKHWQYLYYLKAFSIPEYLMGFLLSKWDMNELGDNHAIY